jgi:hypothetical protein
MADSWDNTPMRAESRIKRNIEATLWLCEEYHATLPQIARIPGVPSLRTFRYWLSKDLYGFRKRYRQARLDHWCTMMQEQGEEDDRAQAYLNGPEAGSRYDSLRERRDRAIVNMLNAAEVGDREYGGKAKDSNFTRVEQAIIDLAGQGYTLEAVERICRRAEMRMGQVSRK